MSVPGWAAKTRDDVISGFVQRGFEAADHGDRIELNGSLNIAGDATDFRIEVVAEFPYQPPRVMPQGGAGGVSWHRDPDGSLCLWDAATAGPLAWANADSVVARIEEWFDHAANGWPDDEPDLDLQGYWPTELGLVIYGADDDRLRGLARTRDLGKGVVEVRPSSNGAKGRTRRAYYVDLPGDLRAPPVSIHEIILDSPDGERLQKLIDSKDIGWILVTYERHGHPGLLALRITAFEPELKVVAVESASAAKPILSLRGGSDHTALLSKHVTIVGVGAVGSAVAEQLARCGVGALTLIDYELLRPGNCIRHIAPPAMIGLPKVDATARTLDGLFAGPGKITTRRDAVVGFAEACKECEASDLVVDATGHNATSLAFLDASAATGTLVMCVALVQEGRVIRVDRAPLLTAEEWAPPVALPIITQVTAREGGCGSPVSLTPPWAVLKAASEATRRAIDLLMDRPVPPSYLEVLEPVADEIAG